MVQYNTVQYNTVHYSTIQYNAIQYGGNQSFLDFQMRPSVQELLCMPYVSQYVHKYAEHIMQLPDHIGHARAPSLNLDQLPIIKQIHRYAFL